MDADQRVTHKENTDMRIIHDVADVTGREEFADMRTRRGLGLSPMTFLRIRQLRVTQCKCGEPATVIFAGTGAMTCTFCGDLEQQRRRARRMGCHV
jgi:hypothetical protein